MDRRIAHLQMIQDVVTRMARHSFYIKGWAVTLVTALFAAAAADDTNEFFVYLAYFPAFMFWALDARFLRQERLFRRLYDRVRILDKGQIEFSMDTSAFESDVDGTWSVMWSRTLMLFHCPLVGSIVVVMLFVIVF